jgi:ribosome-associated translation inhibitor RaiA
MTHPLTIHTTLHQSSPLRTHIERSLRRAIRPFAPHVERAEVWLSDANGLKHGPADKLVRIVLTLAQGGQLVAAAASDDFYASASRAATRARNALARSRDSARASSRGVRRSGRRPSSGATA